MNFLTRALHLREKGIAGIFNITGSGVSGAVVDYRDDVPKVLCGAQEERIWNVTPAPQTLFSTICKQINNVGSKMITDDSFLYPERVYCFLPSFLSTTQVETVHNHYENPVVVDKKYIRNITQSMLEKVSANKKKNATQRHSDIFLIEQSIEQILLNGYQAEMSEGKKAKDVEVSLFISTTRTQVTERITEEISRIFHNDDVTFHTQLYVLYSLLSQAISNENRYLLVHVDAELTDVFLVSGGTLRSICYVPKGYATIIRDFSSPFSLSYQEGENLLLLSAKNSDGEDIKEKVKSALVEIKDGWKGEVLSTIRKSQKTPLYDVPIYFTGGGSIGNELASWLSEKEKESGIGQRPRVKILAPEIFAGKRSLENSVLSNKHIVQDAIFTNTVI